MLQVFPGDVSRHMFCSKLHSTLALEQIAELFPETFCQCSAGFFLLSLALGRELALIEITMVGTIISFFQDAPS
ncbi:MAG: hypothetical protein ACLQBD_30335 [Syntrophobacteraceae bacterium]